ncbi:MAG: response regulator [Blastocatellia bacterium]|nr:response regulator [Blastocatellia bacterium]
MAIVREAPTILIATDNPSQRELLVTILKNARYGILQVDNGRDALFELQNNLVDAVVAEITLPLVNGLEISRQLRSQKSTRHIPILLLSPSITRDDDILSALLSGADDCLAQPFRPQELTLKLKHMLERQHWAIERQQMVENLVWLANGTEAALTSGDFPRIDSGSGDRIGSGSGEMSADPSPAGVLGEFTTSGSHRVRLSETDWEDVEDAMQQALRYFQDGTNDEESALIKSAMTRLSNAVAQAGLYRQARAHARGLEEANEKLQELERLRNEFTNAIVHDIRSPLGSVISTLELIEMELQSRRPDFAELRELNTGARQVCEKLISLINELLDFSKLEAGSLQMSTIPMAPHDILTEAAEGWSLVARRKNIILSYGCDTQLPKVLVDPKNLQRALMNLISNAIKFTPEGGHIWLEAREIEGQQVNLGQRYLVFSVIDSGEGIPAQELPYVFDPYYQARSRTGALGTGLGLAIVKRIAAAHGGNVSVRSQVGIGSAFSIVIPVPPEESPAVSFDPITTDEMEISLGSTTETLRVITKEPASNPSETG